MLFFIGRVIAILVTYGLAVRIACERQKIKGQPKWKEYGYLLSIFLGILGAISGHFIFAIVEKLAFTEHNHIASLLIMAATYLPVYFVFARKRKLA